MQLEYVFTRYDKLEAIYFLIMIGEPNADTAEQHYIDTNSTDSAHIF